MARSSSPSGFHAGVVFVLSSLVLGSAYAFEHWGGLAPCQLCFWQRYPYFALIPLALIAVLVPGLRKPLIGLCLLAFLVGTGIAFYHVGVEAKWWPGPDACAPVAGSIEDMLTREAVVRCDEPATHWLLPFGLSMAFYNLVFSALMSVYCLYAIARKSR